MKMNWVEKFGIKSPIHTIELKQVARVALRLGGDVKGSRVLEIGCGAGLGTELIFDLFGAPYVEAFDYDPDLLRLAQRRLLNKYQDKVKLYEASATRIPAPDDEFDAVFDFGVLHHIPDNKMAVKEVARVLKPGGKFYFQELLSGFVESPVIKFLTRHPAEAQFTWEQLRERLTGADLQVPEKGYDANSWRVIGVARKTDRLSR